MMGTTCRKMRTVQTKEVYIAEKRQKRLGRRLPLHRPIGGCAAPDASRLGSGSNLCEQ